MLTLFTHESSGRRVSYRVGVGLQAKALARTILDRIGLIARCGGSDRRGSAVAALVLAVVMLYLITYDITDDRRREDVATVLSGYGPRVQLSVLRMRGCVAGGKPPRCAELCGT